MKKFKINLLATVVASSITSLAVAMVVEKANQDAVNLEHMVSAKKTVGKNVELMFFQHAKQAQISQDQQHPSCYRMTLSKLNDKVIYFSTEPHRITGSLSVSEFMASWLRHQKEYGMRPNAILHAKTEGKKDSQAVNDIAQLTNLSYDPKKQTLSYTACPLDTKKQFKVTRLDDVNLFIDPFHGWPP